MAPLADLLLKIEGGEALSKCAWSAGISIFRCSLNVALTLPKMMRSQHSSEDGLMAYMFTV